MVKSAINAAKQEEDLRLMKMEEKNDEQEVKFVECPILDARIQAVDDKETKVVVIATIQLPDWPKQSVKIIQE